MWQTMITLARDEELNKLLKSSEDVSLKDLSIMHSIVDFRDTVQPGSTSKGAASGENLLLFPIMY